jgi:hypothetical protein
MIIKKKLRSFLVIIFSHHQGIVSNILVGVFQNHELSLVLPLIIEHMFHEIRTLFIVEVFTGSRTNMFVSWKQLEGFK